MAANSSSSSRASTDLLIPKKWNNNRETSPERTVIWTEPKPSTKTEKRVSVIYYLSRNGNFEHPHFIQVPLSSPAEGLYLKDVINRLNVLRGEGMAYMFSWSSKRSYKNAYVWHDLSENDLIFPVNGRDYVLKGSELLPRSASFRMCETASSKAENSGEIQKFPASVTEKRTRNQSWSSFDNSQNDYRATYKSESSREFSGKLATAAAAAQKAEDRPRRGVRTRAVAAAAVQGSKSVELSREELPSPPSMSSWEYTHTSTVSRSGTVDQRTHARDRTAENDVSSGRVKASRVVMHLITCGSSTSVDSAITKSKSSRAKY